MSQNGFEVKVFLKRDPDSHNGIRTLAHPLSLWERLYNFPLSLWERAGVRD
jgi:hypothetical protein